MSDAPICEFCRCRCGSTLDAPDSNVIRRPMDSGGRKELYFCSRECARLYAIEEYKDHREKAATT